MLNTEMGIPAYTKRSFIERQHNKSKSEKNLDYNFPLILKVKGLHKLNHSFYKCEEKAL